MKIKIIQDRSLLVMKSKNFQIKQKIAAFDYGSTLFWNNENWYHENLPQILKQFVKKDYCIIILSNQNKLLEKEFHEKKLKFIKNIQRIENEINAPIYMRASCLEDYNRKPDICMWKQKWPTEKAFYVGDKITDQIFADNLNIEFYFIDDFLKMYLIIPCHP
jgi:histidinol phosphatase-like enzyme